MSDGCDICRGLTPPPGARCKSCGRGNPITYHHCHARGCATACKPEMLMCLKHWRMVPREIQRRVWATYRPGQCDDMAPSEAWHAAADAAIAAVVAKEAAKGDRTCPRCGKGHSEPGWCEADTKGDRT